MQIFRILSTFFFHGGYLESNFLTEKGKKKKKSEGNSIKSKTTVCIFLVVCINSVFATILTLALNKPKPVPT